MVMVFLSNVNKKMPEINSFEDLEKEIDQFIKDYLENVSITAAKSQQCNEGNYFTRSNFFITIKVLFYLSCFGRWWCPERHYLVSRCFQIVRQHYEERQKRHQSQQQPDDTN